MTADIKEMEITDYNIIQNIKAAFYRLWKLKLVVLFSTLIGFLIALIYITYMGTDFSFNSTAVIYSAVYGSTSDSAAGVTIMNTYSSILSSTRVCDRASAEINNPKITSEYLVNLVENGNVRLLGLSSDKSKYSYRLVMSTSLDSPDYVVEITNAMADAFSGEINELLGQDVIQVFDRATHSYKNTGTSKKLILVIVSLAFFVLSAGVIFVVEFFSSKVYLVSQCCNDKDMILGVLPEYKNR